MNRFHRNKGEMGKASENAISKILATYSSRAAVAWHRIPDAKAGLKTEALADFYILASGKSYLIEVKEVESHEFRLPHGNFDVGQVARMRRFELAGAKSLVFVHFVPISAWRVAQVDYFKDREGGSWDMRDLVPRTLESYLTTFKGKDFPFTEAVPYHDPSNTQ
jgi:hypothetical protein